MSSWRHLDLQTQQQKGERFAVGIQTKGFINASVEHALQDEIQRAQFGQHVAPHGGWSAIAESLCHALLGHLLDQQGEKLRSVRYHTDINGVALVASATMGDAVQR